MTPAEFLSWVIEAAHRRGWSVWIGPVSPTRLVMMHEDGCLIFAEIVRDDDVLTDKQRDFWNLALTVRERIARMFDEVADEGGLSPTYRRPPAPLAVYVWRPSDQDRVETILRSKILA